MRRRCALVGVVVVLALAAAMVGVTTASTQPDRYCGICGDSTDALLRSASEQSSLTIQVQHDGASRWTEQVVLNESVADRLAGDRSALIDAVEDARRDGWTHPLVHDPVMDVRLQNRTVSVTYEVEDVAREGFGGVTLFDIFHTDPSPGAELEADRLVVRPPERHHPSHERIVVSNQPPNAEVVNGSAVWRAGAGPTKETYLAFAREGKSELYTTLAIAAVVGPFLLKHTLVSSIAAVFLFLGAIVGIYTVKSDAADRSQPGGLEDRPDGADDRSDSDDSWLSSRALLATGAVLNGIVLLFLFELVAMVLVALGIVVALSLSGIVRAAIDIPDGTRVLFVLVPAATITTLVVGIAPVALVVFVGSVDYRWHSPESFDPRELVLLLAVALAGLTDIVVTSSGLNEVVYFAGMVFLVSVPIGITFESVTTSVETSPRRLALVPFALVFVPFTLAAVDAPLFAGIHPELVLQSRGSWPLVLAAVYLAVAVVLGAGGDRLTGTRLSGLAVGASALTLGVIGSLSVQSGQSILRAVALSMPVICALGLAVFGWYRTEVTGFAVITVLAVLGPILAIVPSVPVSGLIGLVIFFYPLWSLAILVFGAPLYVLAQTARRRSDVYSGPSIHAHQQ